MASGSHEINALVQLANNLVVSGSGVMTFGTSGNITDNNAGYSLTMNGSGGGLILSGSDSYTGGTIVSAGTLAATTAAAIPYDYSLTISAGGTFIFDPLATASSLVTSRPCRPMRPTRRSRHRGAWWRRFPNRERWHFCWWPLECGDLIPPFVGGLTFDDRKMN